jgi:hypothetical protein
MNYSESSMHTKTESYSISDHVDENTDCLIKLGLRDRSTRCLYNILTLQILEHATEKAMRMPKGRKRHWNKFSAALSVDNSLTRTPGEGKPRHRNGN